MSTIPIEISTEQLLRAVEQLPVNELDAFIASVVALRARRGTTQLSQEETTLLLHINSAHLDRDQQARFDELVAKRQHEEISSEELQELIHMTDAIEQRDVERLEALRELALLRGVTVPAIMEALGISSSTYG